MAKKIFIIFILCSALQFYSQDLDFKILKAVNQTDMPCWDKTMKGVSFSVYPAMPVSVIGIWTHGYINKDDVMMRNGYKSAITIAFAVGITTGLKYAVNRTRPFTKYPNDIVKRDELINTIIEQ